MATYWIVEILDSVPAETPWSSLPDDGGNKYLHIPTPGNNTFDLTRATSGEVIVLYDGSRAVVFPENEYNLEAFEFQVSEASSKNIPIAAESTYTVIKWINEIIKKHYRLKITMHDNQIVYCYFMSSRQTYMQSGAEQLYQYTITVQPYEESGSYE